MTTTTVTTVATQMAADPYKYVTCPPAVNNQADYTLGIQNVYATIANEAISGTAMVCRYKSAVDGTRYGEWKLVDS